MVTLGESRKRARAQQTYPVDVASDEEAVDDQAEAESHREDSSVPVAARRMPQAEQRWQGIYRADEINSCAQTLGSKPTMVGETTW